MTVKAYTYAELTNFTLFQCNQQMTDESDGHCRERWTDARRARRRRNIEGCYPPETAYMTNADRISYLLLKHEAKREQFLCHLDEATEEQIADLRECGVAVEAPFTSDKKTGSAFSWRAMNRLIAQRQEMKQASSWSQKTARIDFSHLHEPICVIALSDTHIGSWGTDHTLLERVVDEIMAVPNLYIAFLGDVAEMAIKMRSVAEVMGNMLDIEEQEMYVEDFLNEIAPRILFSTWDNHSIERAEQQAGTSAIAKLFARRVVYHSGIGHPDIVVGTETYRIAATHRFRGSSIDHPCHGGMRYLLREGNDREIALEGDKHRPGKETAVHSGVPKLALNSGTFNVNSGYGNRYFSLYTCPAFPCFELYPDTHRFNDYWSIGHYLAATGQRAA